MNVKILSKNNCFVAYLEGELDEHSANSVRNKLDISIEMARVDSFVFDMGGVTFMDSTGIGVILGRYKKLKSKNIELYIANPTKNIDKILNMAGIYTIIKKIS